MDHQLVVFRRQYFQLFEPTFLAWPPKQLLRDASVQQWLYDNLFNDEKSTRLPSASYQLRVLKPLVAKIEQSIIDPEEDEISDNIMSRLSVLIASDLPPESTAVQQKSYVTFSCSPHTSTDEDTASEPSITLLERRNLISGSLTTGFRTWEAALHLGAYLLSDAGADIVKGKSVIELGTGTGFLAILCARYLGASHVTATDGDEGVVEALTENLFVNNLESENKVNASVLRWGRGLKGTWVEEEADTWPYDVVLGADITYDKPAISALVATLRFLFQMRPRIQVLISGAVRNTETFETFRHACLRQNFEVTEIDFEPRPIRAQTALFYATAVPLKILSISCPQDPSAT